MDIFPDLVVLILLLLFVTINTLLTQDIETIVMDKDKKWGHLCNTWVISAVILGYLPIIITFILGYNNIVSTRWMDYSLGLFMVIYFLANMSYSI